LRWLWAHSSVPRLRRCSRWAVGEVAVKVKTAGTVRSAGFSGLERCGSVWACPACSARICGTRASWIAEALRRWDSMGGVIGFVTLTVSHSAADALAAVWDWVAAGWTAATNGADWRDLTAWLGSDRVSDGQRRLPWLRVVEVTRGRHGWHVHVHAVVLLRPGTQLRQLDMLGLAMWLRWDAAVVKAGGHAGLMDAGLDCQIVTGREGTDKLGAYFVNSAYELVGSQTKTSSLTPWGILAALVSDADGSAPLSVGVRRRYRRWWGEWEAASRGRRQIGKSGGLGELLGMDDWRSDDEIVAEDEGGTVVCRFERAAWASICDAGAGARILTAFELSQHAGEALLSALGFAQLLGLDDAGVESAPLWVCQDATMPATLERPALVLIPARATDPDPVSRRARLRLLYGLAAG